MHILLLLPAAAAMTLAFWQWRARSGRLVRLQHLVGAGEKPPSRMLSSVETPGAIRLLPAMVVRNLQILGIEPDLRDVCVALTVSGLPIAIAGLLVGPLPALVLAVALILIGLMALNILSTRRIAELGALMPGFLDRVRQLLTVGNSLPTAFVRAVQGSQPRLIEFFTPAIRRMGNGASFADSIRQCAEDIDLYEMQLFATAVATNMRFGGSLNHSLSNLVSYLRKRSSIERELRANTAQIRAGAWVLGLLPMGVAGLIVVQNPSYASWFLTHPTGKQLLAYCVISQIIGAFLMQTIVRTKF